MAHGRDKYRVDEAIRDITKRKNLLLWHSLYSIYSTWFLLLQPLSIVICHLFCDLTTFTFYFVRCLFLLQFSSPRTFGAATVWRCLRVTRKLLHLTESTSGWNSREENKDTHFFVLEKEPFWFLSSILISKKCFDIYAYSLSMLFKEVIKKIHKNIMLLYAFSQFITLKRVRCNIRLCNHCNKKSTAIAVFCKSLLLQC